MFYHLYKHKDNDNVMFIQGTWTSKLAKATLNGSKNGFTYNWDIGRLGWGKSTASDIQFGFPWGLGVDVTNKRLLSANWNSGYGQVFDFDGNFIKSTEPSQSRMEGATTAIQAVVSDTTLSNDLEYLEDITGITISPKKNFCIIKIWMKSCDHQDPNKINVSNIKGLTNQGCIFKKHISQ